MHPGMNAWTTDFLHSEQWYLCIYSPNFIDLYSLRATELDGAPIASNRMQTPESEMRAKHPMCMRPKTSDFL